MVGRPVGGVDGYVSLEVSPLLAHDTDSTLTAARNLHQRGGKPNLFIKIPGTTEGLPAIHQPSDGMAAKGSRNGDPGAAVAFVETDRLQRHPLAGA